MGHFFKTGLWIPLLFFLGALFFCIRIFLKRYGIMKTHGMMIQGDLSDGLVKNLAAVELLKKGKAFLNQGLFSKAVEEIEKAKKLNPSIVDLYLYLAKAYGEMGKITLALKSLHHFLEVAKPYNPERSELISMAREYLRDLENKKNHPHGES